MKVSALRRCLPVLSGLGLLGGLVAPNSRAADPAIVGLCTPANTVTASIQSARLTDADLDGAVDRWTTRGDFNYTAGTAFDPVDGTPPEEPKVHVAFELPGDSATQVFVDTTVGDHFDRVTAPGVRSPVVVWRYVYNPLPNEAVGFFRGRFRNLSATIEPSNKVRFFLSGMSEQLPPFTPPAGGFPIRHTVVIDNRPGAVFCATANMCCHAKPGSGISIKCKSTLLTCQ